MFVPGKIGAMVQSTWDEIPQHYPDVGTDAFVLMPNHVHAIIMLGLGQARGPAPTMSLSDIVHRFKSLTTARYKKGVEDRDWPPIGRRLWQRNYYEHVIRSEGELQRVREYVSNNPAKWADDEYNPDNNT